MFATPRKLPSGSWRIQIYVGEENGKKIRKSFTAKTQKACMKLAVDFWNNNMVSYDKEMTVHDTIQEYLKIKEGSLSPSTYLGYAKDARLYFGMIDNIYISRLDDKDVQYWISTLLRTHSVKTVKNAYGLLRSAAKLLYKKTYDVSFPVKEEPQRFIPTDDDVRLLLENASDDMKICILLSALGTLRRGEVAAVKYKDINRQNYSIYVHADRVKNNKNEWIYKPPKTKDSIRTVFFPKFVIDMIPEGDPEAFIYPKTPDNITKNFVRLRDSLGLKCRFHDLRIYAASIRAYIGVPLKEVQAVGGWASRKTLEEIYDQLLRGRNSQYNQMTIQYFDNILK